MWKLSIVKKRMKRMVRVNETAELEREKTRERVARVWGFEKPRLPHAEHLIAISRTGTEVSINMQSLMQKF